MKAGIYKSPCGNLIYVRKDRSIAASTFGRTRVVGLRVSHRAKDDTVLIEGADYRCTRFADVPNGCTDPQKALNEVFVEREGFAVIERKEEALKLNFISTTSIKDAIPEGRRYWTIEGPTAGAKDLDAIACRLELDGDAENAQKFREAAEATRNGEKVSAFVPASIGKPIESLTPNPADVARVIAERVAEGLGVGVDHTSFDKAAAALAVDQFGVESDEADDTNFALHIPNDTSEQLRILGYRFCHAQSARKHRKQGHHVRYVPEARCYAWRASTWNS